MVVCVTPLGLCRIVHESPPLPPIHLATLICQHKLEEQITYHFRHVTPHIHWAGEAFTHYH